MDISRTVRRKSLPVVCLCCSAAVFSRQMQLMMTPFQHTVHVLQQTAKSAVATPSRRAGALAELAWLLKHERPKTSRKFARQALAISRGTNTSAECSALLADAAHLFRKPAAEKKACEQVVAAKTIALECGDELLQARAMMIEAAYHSKYADCLAGRAFYLGALEIFLRKGTKGDLASVHYGVGYQHGLLKEYSEAMTRMLEARTLFEEYGMSGQALLCSVSLAGYYMHTGDGEAAELLCTSGISEALRQNCKPALMRFYNLYALIQAHIGNNLAACEFFGKAATEALESDDDGLYFSALVNQSQTLLQLGHYAKAAALLTTVVGNAGRFNWDMRIHALNQTGKIFLALGDVPRALKFFLEAYSSVQHHAAGFANGIFLTVAVNLGGAYTHLGEYDKGETILRQAAARASDVGDAALSINAYLALAKAATAVANAAEARNAADQAYSIASNINDQWGMLSATLILAQSDELEGRLPKAADRLRKAVQTATEGNFMPLLAQALQALARVEESLGNMGEAFAALKQYYHVEQSIDNAAAQSAASNMAVEYSIRSLQIQRSELQSKTEFLEMEIRRKEKQLQMIAMQLAQKNEAMKTMRDELKAISTRRGPKSQKARRLLESSVQAHSPSGAWKEFDEQFSRVNGDFVSMLNKLHPELSPTEQKICCLLKIRLSSKEIAGLLYLSPRTVETHRLNIRRKLNIDREHDVSNCLNALG